MNADHVPDDRAQTMNLNRGCSDYGC